MSAQPVKKLVIVGGGTAGWLSAAYLNKALGASVDITLVESAHIPRIGVGEATVSTLRYTLGFIGLSDEDWMPRCSATYKAAIRYDHWNRPDTEPGRDVFYHPFFPRQEPMYGGQWFPEIGEGVSLMHHWHRRWLAGDRNPYAYAAFPSPSLCDAGKAPRFDDGEYAVTTAYHLNANELAAVLAEVATARGVHHVTADVEGADKDARGHITALKTKDGRRLEGDLFLDCTGFRSHVLGGLMGSEFDSDADALFCDRAIAVRADHVPGALRPYTSCHAKESGWIWDIPTIHNAGAGIVYCSDHQSDDEALETLKAYLGNRNIVTDPHPVKFTPGKRPAWVGNVVGIGLSTGFLEPLESTTIFLIEYGLANLVTLFPDSRMDDGRRHRYNARVQAMYDEIRDFIVLHYVGSPRRDSDFWRRVASETKQPDSLRENLAFYREHLPTEEGLKSFAFRERSYACILTGLGIIPDSPHPLLAHLDTSAGEAALNAMNAHTAELIGKLPDHRAFLERMYAAAGV